MPLFQPAYPATITTDHSQSRFTVSQERYQHPDHSGSGEKDSVGNQRKGNKGGEKKNWAEK